MNSAPILTYLQVLSDLGAAAARIETQYYTGVLTDETLRPALHSLRLDVAQAERVWNTACGDAASPV